MKIGIDVLGGDFAPEANVKGAILAHQEHPDLTFVLIGDKEAVLPILEAEGVSPDTFEYIHTTEVIGMDEHPTRAFSRKPNSTIALGFTAMKKGQINAFASTGNTGAMLVGSMHTIRAIAGVIRPTITSILPKVSGGINIVLDVGINADCKPDVLYQFGILGSILAEQVYNIENPRVALLNIGEEEKKGNMLTQSAHAAMKDSNDFNFVGNVEGRDLFGDKCDIIVCDGFTGNVVLKEAEAFYYLIKERGLQDDYFDRFNYEIYGGTPILGVNGNAIIGHGISSPLAVKNMLLLAKDVAEADLSEKIKTAFN